MNNRTLDTFLDFGSKVIHKIADILLPKEKQVVFLEKLGPNGLFKEIPLAKNLDQTTQPGFETGKTKAMFNYKNSLCRQAIWEIKYRGNKNLIRDFSLLLYEFIIEELSDLETFNNFKNPILIPIPSSIAREKEKGFNQCILITRELMKIDRERKGKNFTLAEDFLIKKIDTPHQTKVSNRKKRLENLKGSFALNPASFLISQLKNSPNHSFILIDDVITTGATMHEAFRALKSTGSKKIRGFALAH